MNRFKNNDVLLQTWNDAMVISPLVNDDGSRMGGHDFLFVL